MTAGRIVSTVVSCAVVAGCAAVVVGLARANTVPRTDDRAAAAVAAATSRPAYVPRPVTRTYVTRPEAPASSADPRRAPSTTAAPQTTAVPAPVTRAVARPATVATTTQPPATQPPATQPVATQPVAAPTAARRVIAAPRVAAAPRPTARPAAPAPVRAAPARRAPAPAAAAKPAGSKLPLAYGTGNAKRVITVTAGSSRSTRASVQAWTKLANGRWKKYGSKISAYVGADGIGRASETRSKTPRGSFTITQTFGRKANPGTRLPYLRTTPSDYWISSPGSKYNTRQRCSSCGYDNGVNERLYYTTPFYNYAAVIDYNTRNAPGGVKQGRGSAFFLHVSTGSPTAGCVAIPTSRLKTLLRWLTPSAHPRILIGVT